MRLMDEVQLRGIQAGGPGSGRRPGNVTDMGNHYCKHCGMSRMQDNNKVVPTSGKGHGNSCISDRSTVGHEWVTPATDK